MSQVSTAASRSTSPADRGGGASRAGLAGVSRFGDRCRTRRSIHRPSRSAPAGAAHLYSGSSRPPASRGGTPLSAADIVIGGSRRACNAQVQRELCASSDQERGLSALRAVADRGDLLREDLSLTRQGECGKESAGTPDTSIEPPPTVGLGASRAKVASGLPLARPPFFRPRTDTRYGEMRENAGGRGGASFSGNRTEVRRRRTPSSRARVSS